MTQRILAACLAAALVFGSSGCYGPFKLTKKLHAWNGQVGEKWANEFVFLVLIWVPVYGLATLGDALIFNSIEFWTGENPIDKSAKADSDTKWVAQGQSKAKLSHAAGASGEQFSIEQYDGGQRAASLHVRREGDRAVATNDRGEVLYRVETLPDGTMVARDADGKEVAKRPAAAGQRYARADFQQIN